MIMALYTRAAALVAVVPKGQPREMRVLTTSWHTIFVWLQVLSSDQVLDCDESVVFDAASRWLQADSPSRRKHAPEVILLFALRPRKSIVDYQSSTIHTSNRKSIINDRKTIEKRYSTIVSRRSIFDFSAAAQQPARIPILPVRTGLPYGITLTPTRRANDVSCPPVFCVFVVVCACACLGAGDGAVPSDGCRSPQ